MPYTDLDSIHNPTAGTRPPAAWGAAVNDNFDEIYDETLAKFGAWTNYTPSLVQGVTVNKTVGHARYLKIGRMVIVRLYLQITSSGTAANVIHVGLPPFLSTANNIPDGNWYFYDASSTNNYTGAAHCTSATTAGGILHGSPVVLGQTNGVGVPNQLVSGDVLAMRLTYESTT